MDAKKALYIYTTGYGPCSMFTLKEYLEACDWVRKHPKAINEARRTLFGGSLEI